MGRKSSAERHEAVNCEVDDFCRSFNGLNVVNEAMSSAQGVAQQWQTAVRACGTICNLEFGRLGLWVKS
jgi:hypothetical protein